MEVNYHLRNQILEAVDNQLRDGDPPIATETFARLLREGFSKKKAKEMIAAVLLEEIYDTLKNNEPYDEDRYTRNLNELGKQ
ncbi:MAG: hypothetical protein LBO70_02820 [Clostridiales Family XIII bacterium]|jgi:uncharacterized protein with ATP-grasp and redox domains|nr:hypothetical protein [Clostridiales Family XIII bacterium]